jgi:AraC-like DNA-binding protein
VSGAREVAGGTSTTREPPAALTAALSRLRLDGAIFLRAEYTEGWAYESPPSSALAAALRPDADRLVLFHIVADGMCWVALADGERHWASGGDVIVIPYGDGHQMGGSTEATIVDVLGLIDMPPWERMPLIRHGAGGAQTDVVCGYLKSDDPLFDPALRALPPLFVVRPTGAAAAWVQASIAYALERTDPERAPSELDDDAAVTTRLPELLLTEVLRIHLATAPAADRGWLAALHDPVLGPALALLHAEPARHWTVSDLASCAAVSRSLLDERFRKVLGRSPIRYLTDWRMHLAEDLLATTHTGVAAIARRVGYDSEEAFSRAFKRASGLSPSHWRAARSPIGH